MALSFLQDLKAPLLWIAALTIGGLLLWFVFHQGKKSCQNDVTIATGKAEADNAKANAEALVEESNDAAARAALQATLESEIDHETQSDYDSPMPDSSQRTYRGLHLSRGQNP